MMYSKVRIYTATVSLALTLTAPFAKADHPSLNLETGAAGAIHTSSAVPLPAGSAAVTFKVEHTRNNTFSNAELETFAENGKEVHGNKQMQTTTLTGAYGLNDNLTVGFSLPYIDRQGLKETSHHESEDEHESEHGVEALGDSKGMGDLTLYGQYRLFSNQAINSHAAVIFGIKAPTGKTNHHTDDNEVFEAEHQPGSGSWDGLAGLAYTKQAQNFTLDLSAIYTRTSKGTQDTTQGNSLSYNAALSVRLGGDSHGPTSDHGHHTHAGIQFYDLIMELNGDWRKKVDINGTSDNNTGGNLIYLSPGVRVQFDSPWTATGSLKLPIVENLNGDQSEPKWQFNLGVSRAL